MVLKAVNTKPADAALANMPPAHFILLPDGKVKLINALPFICGDLRRQSLAEVWRNYQRAWKDPRVVRFIAELSRDESLVGRLHERIEL